MTIAIVLEFTDSRSVEQTTIAGTTNLASKQEVLLFATSWCVTV